MGLSWVFPPEWLSKWWNMQCRPPEKNCRQHLLGCDSVCHTVNMPGKMCSREAMVQPLQGQPLLGDWIYDPRTNSCLILSASAKSRGLGGHETQGKTNCCWFLFLFFFLNICSVTVKLPSEHLYLCLWCIPTINLGHGHKFPLFTGWWLQQRLITARETKKWQLLWHSGPILSLSGRKLSYIDVMTAKAQGTSGKRGWNERQNQQKGQSAV